MATGFSPEELHRIGKAEIARYEQIANSTPCSHNWTPDGWPECERFSHIYPSDITYAQECITAIFAALASLSAPADWTRFPAARECPDTCPDTRRKLMADANGTVVEMCYAHIAAMPTGPVKPIYVYSGGRLLESF